MADAAASVVPPRRMRRRLRTPSLPFVSSRLFLLVMGHSPLPRCWEIRPMLERTRPARAGPALRLQFLPAPSDLVHHVADGEARRLGARRKVLEPAACRLCRSPHVPEPSSWHETRPRNLI